MAQTQAQIGYGTLLQREVADASPVSFQTIVEIAKIGAFGSKRALLDATHMQSPDGFMEYVLGLKDGVELALEGNFRPDDDSQGEAAGLINEHNTAHRSTYRIVLPGAFGAFTFSGLVVSWSATIDAAAVIKANFGIKITGAIHFDAFTA